MVMLGGGCLAGIGFTMSIFIGSLALEGNSLNDAKIGTLAGSAISAVLGCALLLMFMPRRSQATGTPLTRETRDDDSTVSTREPSC